MNVLAWFFWYLAAFCSYVAGRPGGHGGGHHHVKIIVPHHVKTIKHTHTIYKTIHHGHGGGHGGGGGGGGGGGHHSHGGHPAKLDWH